MRYASYLWRFIPCALVLEPHVSQIFAELLMLKYIRKLSNKYLTLFNHRCACLSSIHIPMHLIGVLKTNHQICRVELPFTSICNVCLKIRFFSPKSMGFSEFAPKKMRNVGCASSISVGTISYRRWYIPAYHRLFRSVQFHPIFCPKTNLVASLFLTPSGCIRYMVSMVVKFLLAFIRLFFSSPVFPFRNLT